MAIGKRRMTSTATPCTGIPSEHEYLLRREVAKSHLVQAKVDVAEREAISGRLKEARKELLDAMYLDPTNRFVRQRLTELSALAPVDPQERAERSGAGRADASRLRERARKASIFAAIRRAPTTRWRGNSAWRWPSTWTCAPWPVRFKVDDVDFPTAMRLLGDMTGTFWRPLAKHLFFVSAGHAAKTKGIRGIGSAHGGAAVHRKRPSK